MTLYLIQNNEVCGIASADGEIAGFEVVESDLTLDPPEVYYADGEIFAKPDRPSQNHFWNPQTHVWEAIEPEEPPAPAPQPDWAQFRLAIATSPAYMRIASATPENQTLNPGVVSLLWQVAANPALVQEIGMLWALMKTNAQITVNEIEELNSIASAANMPIALDDDGNVILVSPN